MSKLTAQQEKFCQAVADGMSQADAYRAAYRASGMKPSSIWEKASELAANGKVASRIGALKDALAKKGLWTREQAVIALIAETTGDRASDRINALKALNEMHGYNAPLKADVTLHMPKTIRLVALSGD